MASSRSSAQVCVSCLFMCHYQTNATNMTRFIVIDPLNHVLLGKIRNILLTSRSIEAEFLTTTKSQSSKTTVGC